MTDLGTLGGNQSYATAINDAGQVTGTSYTAAGVEHAFRWEGGVMTDLGTLGGGTLSFGVAINGAGQVTGYSATANTGLFHATVWRVRSTPVAQVQLILAQVELLKAAGTLGKRQASLLAHTLNGAIASLKAGNSRDAVNQLNAFIQQVTVLMSDRVLTPAQGQPLIDAAKVVIAAVR